MIIYLLGVVQRKLGIYREPYEKEYIPYEKYYRVKTELKAIEFIYHFLNVSWEGY
jgi:hypothetical protein